MKKEEVKTELANFLKNKYKIPNVVVMPDFFFDRIITLEDNLESFSRVLERIALQKGGSIDNCSQIDTKGGNAINTAVSLATLGANVTPIVCTNKNGAKKIKSIIKKPNLKSSHIKIKDRASITTSIELLENNQKINVMLRDLGDLENFNISDFNEKDENIIKKADYVCIFNWAGTKNYGTELAKKIFSMVKRTGRGKTYYDTADPNSNKNRIQELIEKVLKSNFIDILSLNENEAITYASVIDSQMPKIKQLKRNKNPSLEAARVLAKKLNSRIDLHTSKFAATITKKSEFLVPTFKIKPSRVTGAGDSWNAGNIIGDMNCLSNQSRLILANAVSACYLLNPKGVYPTKKRLLRFIKKEFNNYYEINYQSPIF